MMADLHASQSHSRRTAPQPCASSSQLDGRDRSNWIGEPENELSVSALARAAREFYSRYTNSADTLTAVTAAACQLISGAHSASIALTRSKGKIEFLAPTGVLAASVDDIQCRIDDGPSLLSIRSREPVLICDVRTESRFPKFVAAALRNNGFRSALSLTLDTGKAVLGALTVYSPEAQAFRPSDISAASALATHGALALASSMHEEQLALALASRDTIGQAKGMIMERYGTDAQRAFAMLSTISQDTNTPVVTLASQLTGRQPRRPNPGGNASYGAG